MKKTCYRFFGGLLGPQERWLNRMAAEGWRLVRCGQVSYEFEQAAPGQVQYCVEYVGHKSKAGTQAYKEFLEEMGCRVFYKNINWHYSAGKTEVRPWAEKGGRIATRNTTLDQELLIVEKENDGRPFALHTTYEDQIGLYRTMQKPWLFMFVMFAGAGLLARLPAMAAVGLLMLPPVLLQQIEIAKLKRKAQTREWEEAGPASRSRGKQPAVCAALCLLLAVGAFFLLRGGTRSFFGSRIGWVEQADAHHWSAHYTYFDGQCTKRLATAQGAVLHVSLTTEKGMLALEIQDADGNVLLAEQGLESSEWTLKTPGAVTVRLEAQRHTGSFSLDW